jgi:midasin
MVQDFSEIKDKRILVYYSQIIFESIGIDFTTE